MSSDRATVWCEEVERFWALFVCLLYFAVFMSTLAEFSCALRLAWIFLQAPNVFGAFI